MPHARTKVRGRQHSAEVAGPDETTSILVVTTPTNGTTKAALRILGNAVVSAQQAQLANNVSMAISSNRALRKPLLWSLGNYRCALKITQRNADVVADDIARIAAITRVLDKFTKMAGAAHLGQTIAEEDVVLTTVPERGRDSSFVEVIPGKGGRREVVVQRVEELVLPRVGLTLDSGSREWVTGLLQRRDLHPTEVLTEFSTALRRMHLELAGASIGESSPLTPIPEAPPPQDDGPSQPVPGSLVELRAPTLQSFLHELKGREFGDLDAKRAFIAALNDVLHLLQVRLACPSVGCGRPSSLSFGPQGRGQFRFSHSEAKYRSVHGGTYGVPQLDLVGPWRWGVLPLVGTGGQSP